MKSASDTQLGVVERRGPKPADEAGDEAAVEEEAA